MHPATKKVFTKKKTIMSVTFCVCISVQTPFNYYWTKKVRKKESTLEDTDHHLQI